SANHRERRFEAVEGPLHAVEDLVEGNSEGRCTRSHLVCNVHCIDPAGTNGRVEFEVADVEGVHPCLLSPFRAESPCVTKGTGVGAAHDATFPTETGTAARHSC